MAEKKPVTYPDTVELKLKASYRHWPAGFVMDTSIGTAFEHRKAAPGVFEPVGKNAEGFLAFEKAAIAASAR